MKATYKNEEFAYSFWTYVPQDLQAGEKLPLILFLHGAGERGEDLDILFNNGAPKCFKENPPVRAILVAPQCPNGITWANQVERLKSFFDKIIATYPVDEDKVTLTGLSMGGFGTWEFATTYPEMLAGIAPICGGGQAWRCDALLHMPIRTFHSDDDPIVSINYTLDFVNRLKAMGANPDFTLLHGLGHDSWTYAYTQTDLFDWLIKQNRKNN